VVKIGELEQSKLLNRLILFPLLVFAFWLLRFPSDAVAGRTFLRNAARYWSEHARSARGALASQPCYIGNARLIDGSGLDASGVALGLKLAVEQGLIAGPRLKISAVRGRPRPLTTPGEGLRPFEP
jgi:hypothetical protein